MLSYWIYIHGAPYYLLSDQGSNVDSVTIKEICNILGIEKRRSSAYHSQGNGFAERNIRSIKDILRSILLARNLPQHKWRALLPEIAFALNTSISKATKHIPYNIVFGRSARLPIDVLFNDNAPPIADPTTPTDYAQERYLILRDTFNSVTSKLHLNQLQMQAQYNKHIHFHDYKEGEKVWLKVKFYKTGENRKLAPRRKGPWTILRKLPKGVNFEIFNEKTSEKKIVHHDRLCPCKSFLDGDHKVVSSDIRIKDPWAHHTIVSFESSSSEEDNDASSDISIELASDVEDSDVDNPTPPRQFPRRERRARQLPDNIPWDAIRI